MAVFGDIDSTASSDVTLLGWFTIQLKSLSAHVLTYIAFATATSA